MPSPLFDLQHVTPPGGNPAAGRSYLYIDGGTGKAWWKKSDGSLRRAEFVPSSLDSDLLPDTHHSRNLGSNAVRWKDLYLSNALDVDGNVKLGDSVTDSHTINGTTTHNGNVTVTRQGADAVLSITTQPAHIPALFFAKTGGTRWSLWADGTTESGGSTGSHFVLGRWLDNGTSYNAIHINRTTGNITLQNDAGQILTVHGKISLPDNPRAFTYVTNDVNLPTSWTVLPLTALQGGAYISANAFVVPPNGGGWYRVSGMAQMRLNSGSSTNSGAVGIFVNGVEKANALVTNDGPPFALMTIPVVWEQQLNAGDSVTIRAVKHSGSIDFLGGNNPCESVFTFERVIGV